MQKKYVIEVIVDFRDKNKYPVMDTLATTCAANLFAGAVLLADGQKPDVICYSEDFYVGRTDLEVIALQGVPTTPPASGKIVESYSDEFLDAMKGD